MFRGGGGGVSLSFSLARTHLNDQQKRYENSRCVLLVLLSADVFDDALISRFFSSIFIRSSLFSSYVFRNTKSGALLDALLLLLLLIIIIIGRRFRFVDSVR